MPKPWLKSWSKSLDNPKIQLLTGDQFKLWHNLLWIALRTDKNGELPTVDLIAFQLRIDRGMAVILLDEQVSLGLVEKRSSRYVIHDWHHWQGDGKSDAERKKEQRDREKKCHVTSNGTGHVTQNGTVTDESQSCHEENLSRAKTKTKTKTKTEKNNKSAPDKPAFVLPDWVPQELWEEHRAVRKRKRGSMTPYAPIAVADWQARRPAQATRAGHVRRANRSREQDGR